VVADERSQGGQSGKPSTGIHRDYHHGQAGSEADQETLLANFIHAMIDIDNVLAFVWVAAFGYIVLYTGEARKPDKLWTVCGHLTVWIALYMIVKHLLLDNLSQPA
jgi:hypothetical protein